MKIPKLRKTSDGRAFVEIPKSGRKRQYLGKWGSQEAEIAYRQWVAQFLADPIDRPGRQLIHANIASLILEYLQSHKDDWSQSVYSTTKTALNHFGDQFADRPPHEIGPRMLSQFKETLKGTKYRRGKTLHQKYSSKTMNDHLKAVKRLVKWACRMEYLAPETYAAMSTVEGFKADQGRQTEPVRPVPWAEVEKTLPYLSAPVAAMVQVQFLCGMRPSEIRRMRHKDIDQSGPIWLYVPHEHKNTHRGLVLTKAIVRPAQALLRPFLTQHDSDYVFCPKAATRAVRASQGASIEIDESKPLQPGDHYAASSYLQAVRRGIEKARKDGVTVEDWKPAQLRHSIATLLKPQLGWQAAQVFLGHADVDTTAIYAERTVQELLAVAEAVEGLDLTA